MGLYKLRADGGLHVGDLAALCLPDQLALLLSQRGYVPLSVPLLKPVAALPGQTVAGPTEASRLMASLLGMR